MKNTPLSYNIVKEQIKLSKLPKVGDASIRELVKLVNEIEQETGEKFIRMEMGVPGLKPVEIGIQAEKDALADVAAIYPNIEGIASLKEETSRFVKLFMDIDVAPDNCVPSVGSMQGGCAAFMVANRTFADRSKTLFLDPGFPVQKQQIKVLGQEYLSFDVYDYRGGKLKEKLESVLKTGEVSSIIYSNPNNPSWICFTDQELQIIGELATKYDVVVIEDLAYFGMDFRKDYSIAGEAPFQPTVANYTNNYMMLISGSKTFSYAGQRIGLIVISPELHKRKYSNLLNYYASEEFGHSIIYGALYALSSGVTHSVQYAMAAILKACNNGEYNFVDGVKVYGEHAGVMKKMFVDHGFSIVYDQDDGELLADGFYFTISYPGFSGSDLIEELMYYGISAISLNITGSTRTEGLRACVSQIQKEQLPVLEERLIAFKANH